MKNMFVITYKELRAYFTSPIAYVVIAAFLVIMGVFFSLIVYFTRVASLRGVFGNMAFILLFVAPALTMRLLAEEQRSGTIELLLTLPVRDWQVVLGKFLASLAVYAVILALTLYYPLLMLRLGNPDRGPIVSAYLGLLLLGASFLSIGVFTSSLSRALSMGTPRCCCVLALSHVRGIMVGLVQCSRVSLWDRPGPRASA